MTLILGIETSCDETAAAVVDDGRTVCSSVVSSQVDLHARFGGVVPEVASRAHVELITPVIAEALVEAGVELSDLDAVAACHGPGLAGALLVGVAAAKALAVAAGLPYVGVNHLEAHLHAAWLEDPDLAAAARGADRVGWPHDDRRDGGPRPLPGGRPDRRRRRGGGVRQGRPPPRPRLPRRTRDRPARARGRSGGGALPARDARRRRLLLLGPQDRGGEPHAPRARRTRCPTSRRRSRRRSSTSWWPSWSPRPTRPARRCSRSAAGWPPTPASGPRWPTPPPRPAARCSSRPPSLCTDNGAMIAATAWWRLRADGPTPLDAGADPNLRLVPDRVRTPPQLVAGGAVLVALALALGEC